MRKIWIYSLLSLVTLGLPACQSDGNEVGSTSVLRTPANRTSLDDYIEREITKPYNIEVYYRYREFEIGRGTVTSPAAEENSLQFVNVLKYLFVEPYVELKGIDFVRRFSPQAIVLNGTLGFNPPPSLTSTRASTISGVKIVFMNMNNFYVPSLRSEYELMDEYQRTGSPLYEAQRARVESQNTSNLNDIRLTDDYRVGYLRTIFHESAHTFHQRVEPTRDFDRISSLDYKQATWSTIWTREGRNSLHYGFISNYASQEPHEDFAELFGNYIVLTPEEWEQRLVRADVIPEGRTESGRSIIERKLGILKDYLRTQWDLDLDNLRTLVQNRYPDFSRQDFSQMTTTEIQP